MWLLANINKFILLASLLRCDSLTSGNLRGDASYNPAGNEIWIVWSDPWRTTLAPHACLRHCVTLVVSFFINTVFWNTILHSAGKDLKQWFDWPKWNDNIDQVSHTIVKINHCVWQKKWDTMNHEKRSDTIPDKPPILIRLQEISF